MVGEEGLSTDLLSSWWFLSTHRGSGQASDSFHKTDWMESVQFKTTSLQTASPELHEDRFPSPQLCCYGAFSGLSVDLVELERCIERSEVPHSAAEQCFRLG